MKAPTNITGPDGVTVQRGEDIPADWFKAMPDLKAHLDALPPPPDESPAGSKTAQAKMAARNEAAAEHEAEAEPTEDTPSTVKATAAIGRKRGNQ